MSHCIVSYRGGHQYCIVSQENYCIVAALLSTELSVSSGVAQGSVLGLRLFSICINDLPTGCVMQCKSICWWHAALLWNQLFQINKWITWLIHEMWKMLFNTNICKIIAFSNRTQADPMYTLGGNSLRYVQDTEGACQPILS